MRNERKCVHLKVNAKRPVYALLLISMSLLLLQSCYKDRFGFDKIKGGEWEPTLAAPIVNSRLTMQDMQEMADVIWGEDPDGMLSLIYRDTALTDVTQGYVTLPDQASDTIFPYAMDPNMLPGDSDNEWFVHTQKFQVTPGFSIDSMMFSDGTIDLQITTNINHDCTIKIVIPQLRKFGVSTFERTIDIPYNGQASNTVTVSYPLADYALGLIDDGNGNMTFTQHINISTTMLNNPNNSPYQFEISEELNNLKYFNVFGYFGQQSLNLTNGHINIGIFKNNYIGSTEMEDAILRLDVLNTYGTDFDFVIDDVTVKRNAQQVSLTSPLLPNLPLNGVPVYNYGDTLLTQFVFDPNNSNIVDAVNLNPYEMFIDAHVVSNPAWSTFTRNFISDRNQISVNAELEIPLHGKAMDFTISDTSDFELDNIEEIKNLELRINTSNMFPVEAELQILFADSNGVVLDSVFVDKAMILNAAAVSSGPEYKATIPAHQTAVVNLDASKLDNLYKMEKIIIQVGISTLNGGTEVIKIYDDYYVDVVLSSKADLYVEF